MSPESSMLPPKGLPSDRSVLHPWIRGILDKDALEVALEIRHRLSANESEETAYLVERLADFTPRRIWGFSRVAYVQCIRRTMLNAREIDAGDICYIAQPLPDVEIERRITYFESALRPLMREFLSKFAGCGEEMEGTAGQFAMHNDYAASEVADNDSGVLEHWHDSRLLYSAANGDSVFVNRQGATAWHVMETNKVINLSTSFSAFIEHYAAFRAKSECFDSWASLKFLKRTKLNR